MPKGDAALRGARIYPSNGRPVGRPPCQPAPFTQCDACCPNCDGFVVRDQDIYGKRDVCLNCGHGVELKPDGSPLTADSSVNRADDELVSRMATKVSVPVLFNPSAWAAPDAAWTRVNFTMVGLRGQIKRDGSGLRNLRVDRIEAEPAIPPQAIARGRLRELLNLLAEGLALQGWALHGNSAWRDKFELVEAQLRPSRR